MGRGVRWVLSADGSLEVSLIGVHSDAGDLLDSGSEIERKLDDEDEGGVGTRGVPRCSPRACSRVTMRS